jgi:hypothetical protein
MNRATNELGELSSASTKVNRPPAAVAGINAYNSIILMRPCSVRNEL